MRRDARSAVPNLIEAPISLQAIRFNTLFDHGLDALIVEIPEQKGPLCHLFYLMGLLFGKP